MKDWIIAVANSEADEVEIHRFYGSESDLKKVLLNFVKRDRNSDLESFDYGTESIDEIESNGVTLNAMATYYDYHINYTAIEFSRISFFNEY